MPEFVEPGDNGEQTEQTSTEVVSPDLPKVEIGGDEMHFEQAVDVMAKMVDNPEAFDIASGSQIREANNDLHELRKAVAEVADAVEMLSEVQADVVGGDAPATVSLSDEKMGAVYDPTDYGGGE